MRPRGRGSRRFLLYAGLLVGFCVLLAFVGCGATAGNGQLVAAMNGVNFGAVTIGQAGTATVSVRNTGSGDVEVSSIGFSGGPFTLAVPVTYPFTIASGSTYSFQVRFNPSQAGQVTGMVTVFSNAASTPPAVGLTGLGVNVAATAPAGQLSGISCNNSSMVGAGTDNCFVALNGPAGTGGLTVSLDSTSAAVTVPATVTVPAGTTGVGFSAKVTAVSSSQSAVLTANAGEVSESFALELGAALRILSASASHISFGNVEVNATETQSVVLTSSGTESVTITSTSLTGTGFAADGLSLPVVLNPGQAVVLNIEFNPTAAGGVNGKLTIATNNSSGKSMVIGLSGTGAGSGGGSGGSPGGTAVPAALSCASATMTGSGTDSCTLSLSAAGPAGGLAVTLSSSNTAVTVPSSVTVPSGAISVEFSATAAAVSTAQTATLSAVANGGSQSFALQLNAAGAFLSASQASLTFGNISLNGLGTQTLTLTSTGTQPVTVSAVLLTGSAFTMSGVTVPVTLNPGQSITMLVEFVPTLAGAASGQISVSSSATPGGSMMIPLSGTGEVPYEVNLAWSAPTTSADAVVGYNIYRTLSGTSSYELLNSAVNTMTTFTDSTVENGQSYVYYVTSVDSAGVESTPSNAFDVAIP